MKYFLFSLLVTTLSGCTSYYKTLVSTEASQECNPEFRPAALPTNLYHASVDVVGKHIGGLLFIKEMPDSSRRLVFTNQAGLTFFDFEFDKHGKFSVKRIIDDLDRKSVVSLLQKDFELLMGYSFRRSLQTWRHNDETYYGFTDGSTKSYFTVINCSMIGRLETGSRRKRIVSITMDGNPPDKHDTIVITHFTFPMTINLKKIEKDAHE
jgi:hypothetical protein